MKKTFLLALLLTLLFPFQALCQDEERGKKGPDSAYIHNEDDTKKEEDGLFNLLPFFGNKNNEVPAEKLKPSIPSQPAKPVLPEEDLNELRVVVAGWLTGSEITEPAVRKAEDGRFFRDYIVFNDEYRIEVLKGDSNDKPFLAHIFVDGDHFQTTMHETSEEAQSDRNFNHTRLDFRVIFERLEKWDYSTSGEDAPIVFRKEWVFKKLQTKVTAADASKTQTEKDAARIPPAAPGPTSSASPPTPEMQIEEQQKPQ